MEKRCKGCGAEILTIRTGFGRIDVDAEQVWIVKGSGDAFYTAEGEIIFGVPAGDADDDPDKKFAFVYTPHRGKCPNGGKKPRKRNRPSGYR